MQWLIVLIALAAGAMNPLQNTNAELNKHWQQPLWTAIWVYLSGLACVVLVQLFLRQPLPVQQQISNVPWWAWLGGLISVVPTIAGLLYAQRLGSGIFTGLTITASVVVSILLDHLGLIGFKQHAASPMRLVGGALMVAGVWLVSRF